VASLQSRALAHSLANLIILDAFFSRREGEKGKERKSERQTFAMRKLIGFCVAARDEILTAASV
jgi:hypothetical protein